MTRRSYIDLPHGQVHVRIHTNTGKPWAVLLHQSPSSSTMFEALIGALSTDFQVIAPDMPGFGNSDPLDGPVSVTTLATVTAVVLDHFDVSRALVFGHHTGAALAAELAATRPDICAALALCGPPLLSEAQRAALPAMAPVEEPTPDGGHLARMWAKLRAKETTAPPALSTRELTLAFQARATRNTYAAVAAHDFAGALSKITCPILMFAGERDSLVDCLAAAAEAAPHASVVRLDDAGGYVCDLKPDLVAGLLKGLWAEVVHGS